PVVGVAGLLEDAGLRTTQWFKADGQRIALLGPETVSLGGSEYLWTLHRRRAGRLAPLDLELERRVQTACRAAIEAGLVASAPDCAEGGVGVALAEAAVTGPRPIGAGVSLHPSGRAEHGLISEGPSHPLGTVVTGSATKD